MINPAEFIEGADAFVKSAEHFDQALVFGDGRSVCIQGFLLDGGAGFVIFGFSGASNQVASQLVLLFGAGESHVRRFWVGRIEGDEDIPDAHSPGEQVVSDEGVAFPAGAFIEDAAEPVGAFGRASFLWADVLEIGDQRFGFIGSVELSEADCQSHDDFREFFAQSGGAHCFQVDWHDSGVVLVRELGFRLFEFEVDGGGVAANGQLDFFVKHLFGEFSAFGMSFHGLASEWAVGVFFNQGFVVFSGGQGLPAAQVFVASECGCEALELDGLALVVEGFCER